MKKFFLALIMFFVLWPLTSFGFYFLHRWSRNGNSGDFLFLSAGGTIVVLMALCGKLLDSFEGFLVFGGLYLIGAVFFLRETARRNSAVRLMLLREAAQKKIDGIKKMIRKK